MRYALFAIAAAACLYGLHRLAVYAEGRGWIRYRDARGAGSALGNAFLEVQAIFEPSKEYVLEERKKDEAEERESGDPPAKP